MKESHELRQVHDARDRIQKIGDSYVVLHYVRRRMISIHKGVAFASMMYPLVSSIYLRVNTSEAFSGLMQEVSDM